VNFVLLLRLDDYHTSFVIGRSRVRISFRSLYILVESFISPCSQILGPYTSWKRVYSIAAKPSY